MQAPQFPRAPAPASQQQANSISYAPNTGADLPHMPLQASQLPIAPGSTWQQQATMVVPPAPAGYHPVQQPPMAALPPSVAGAASPSVEMQLLEYLNDRFLSDEMLSEAVVQQLVASAGPRPLELNIKSQDEGAFPLLHLVVMNTGTPAPFLENIIANLIQLGAAPEAEDSDGDNALAVLIALAYEHREDDEALSEDILAAQLGAVVALLNSKTLKVTQKEAMQVCQWLRQFAPTRCHAQQRVFDALAEHVGHSEVASAWCSEELLAYLDSKAFDAKRPVEKSQVLGFLERGASPSHSQNGATALLMIILNPYNNYEELIPIFRAMLEKEPGCAAIKDGFKLLPVQWAADYRNISSQHKLVKPNPASLLALLPSIAEKLPADVDAGEHCISVHDTARTCARKKNTLQELRFKEGDRVICRVQIPGGERVWEEGSIVDVGYREDCWPDRHPGAPYEVLLDIGTRVFALVDHDRIIQKEKTDKNNDVSLFGPIFQNQAGKSQKSNAKAKAARFQRRQKDDGSWELVDTVSGKARPIASDSD